MSDLGTARIIAADWHGGQHTAMYSFTSTGHVYDYSQLVREIEQELAHLNSGKHPFSRREAKQETERLTWLLKFIQSNYS